MTFTIASLLTGSYFPYSYTFAEADGFEISYRDVPEDALIVAAEEYADDLRVLGFTDSLSALAALMGMEVTGEERIVFDQVYDTLGVAQRVAMAGVMRRVTASLLSRIVGSWSDPAPVTRDACAALPASMQAKILALAAQGSLSAAETERLGELPSA
jgi:hypothetical protein